MLNNPATLQKSKLGLETNPNSTDSEKVGGQIELNRFLTWKGTSNIVVSAKFKYVWMLEKPPESMRLKIKKFPWKCLFFGKTSASPHTALSLYFSPLISNIPFVHLVKRLKVGYVPAKTNFPASNFWKLVPGLLFFSKVDRRCNLASWIRVKSFPLTSTIDVFNSNRT